MWYLCQFQSRLPLYYKFVYFYQHWCIPCRNKCVSGHVFLVVYTDETYGMLFIARNSQGEFLWWQLSCFTWNVNSIGPLVPTLLCGVFDAALLLQTKYIYRAACDRHLHSITTSRIYIVELKKSDHDDVSKPRSLLLWTWLRHPVDTRNFFSSVTGSVGYFVLTYFAQVHCNPWQKL